MRLPRLRHGGGTLTMQSCCSACIASHACSLSRLSVSPASLPPLSRPPPPPLSLSLFLAPCCQGHGPLPGQRQAAARVRPLCGGGAARPGPRDEAVQASSSGAAHACVRRMRRQRGRMHARSYALLPMTGPEQETAASSLSLLPTAARPPPCSEAQRCSNERGADLCSLLRSLDARDVARLDIDDRQDGALVINAAGTIMTLNSVRWQAARHGHACVAACCRGPGWHADARKRAHACTTLSAACACCLPVPWLRLSGAGVHVWLHVPRAAGPQRVHPGAPTLLNTPRQVRLA